MAIQDNCTLDEQDITQMTVDYIRKVTEDSRKWWQKYREDRPYLFEPDSCPGYKDPTKLPMCKGENV